MSLAVASPAGKQSPTESASTVMKYFMCIVVSLYYKLLPGVILLIADLFHPRHAFAVQPFTYGEMRHGGIRGRAVPVLDVGRTQHHVPLPDDLYRASPFLGQPDAGRNEQGLAQRVGMPFGARTRLKGDVGTVDALWCLCFKSRINADIACKILTKGGNLPESQVVPELQHEPEARLCPRQETGKE